MAGFESQDFDPLVRDCFCLGCRCCMQSKREHCMSQPIWIEVRSAQQPLNLQMQ